MLVNLLSFGAPFALETPVIRDFRKNSINPVRTRAGNLIFFHITMLIITTTVGVSFSAAGQTTQGLDSVPQTPDTLTAFTDSIPNDSISTDSVAALARTPN